jgi:hypothetical protein
MTMKPKARRMPEPSTIELSPGVSAFTLNKVPPSLRAELDRRIMAIAEGSADLMGSDREAVIEATLRRFAGWITSTPTIDSSQRPPIWRRIARWITPTPAGRGGDNRPAVMSEIPEVLAQSPFEERWRLVIIDQSHKFTSALNSVMAVGGGAIAAKWRSHYRQLNYEYREDHKQRDDKIYAIRGNWQIERGFMKAGPAGYTDEITQPAEEPMCRCYYVYEYGLRALPDDMITQKGRDELARIDRELSAG